MSRRLLIWGAGGHGSVVLDVARSSKQFDSIMFVDDDPAKRGSSFCGCEVVSELEPTHVLGTKFIIAVGDNYIRGRCFGNLVERGLDPTTLVHSSAAVSRSAHLGPGTIVMPGAVINAGAQVGPDCIVNSGAIVEHDCRIGAHVHISPRVALGGRVCVGDFAHVGIGAIVLPGAVVGEESIVGAGAVILKEAPPRCTVVGVPARVIRRN